MTSAEKKTFVVTGSASGMGAAVAAALRDQGHRVIGVDIHDADVVADLSTVDGRRHAVSAVMAASSGRLDGAVLAAGLGPGKGREQLICEVNVLGVTALLTGLRPALAVTGEAKVVVFGSNSTTATPLVPRSAIRALERGNTDAAARILRALGPLGGPAAYAASKIAVSRWCRRQAVTAQWAGAGIRLNILAPGPVLTPLLRSQLDGEAAASVKSFPVPIREYGTPEQLAAWTLTMLSPTADFMVGSVVTVDGGTEALLRPTGWPSRMPITGLPRMLWKMARAKRNGQTVDYSRV